MQIAIEKPRVIYNGVQLTGCESEEMYPMAAEAFEAATKRNVAPRTGNRFNRLLLTSRTNKAKRARQRLLDKKLAAAGVRSAAALAAR